MIVSISGPTRSGKSTILTLLKDNLPDSTIYIEDLYYNVWLEMVELGDFTEFTEITKDREFMFMYISRICDKYDKIIKKYSNNNNLVVLECCYLDYLIYSQLNSWYHYPLVSHLESTVLKFLKMKDCIDRVYMTTANDSNYPIGNTKFDHKTSKTVFNRNRALELSFYDIYRDNRNVLTLPSDTMSCDKIILDDLKKLNLI